MTPTTDTRDLLAEIERANERIAAFEGSVADAVTALVGERDAALERVKELEAILNDGRSTGHDLVAQAEFTKFLAIERLTAQVRELREALGQARGLCRCHGSGRIYETCGCCYSDCDRSGCVSLRAALSRTEPKEAPTIRESQTVGPDLGPCPVSGECRGRVHALISEDGSAWEADLCNACGRRWWHDPPKLPHLAKLDTPARSDTVAVDPRTHEAAMRVVRAASNMMVVCRFHDCTCGEGANSSLAKALAAFDAIGGG